jgi:glycosyltransferase involved in cell wall biosynthesis
VIVLLPVYRPGDHLPDLVEELRDADPAKHVLIVDDGSGAEADDVLAAADDGPAVTVLRHPTNRGKGIAIKTGLTWVHENFPDHDAVTADADGQHSVADILRVAERVGSTGRIVLGVRSFDTDVPARSRFGNTLTRALFRFATGHDVRDTQTGLRGYPAALVPWLREIPGERFEYEMNTLLEAARAGHPVEEVTITTTYLAGNKSSHFGSLSDSVRIYRPLLLSVMRLR